jgi:uncharacterized membrane protein
MSIEPAGTGPVMVKETPVIPPAVSRIQSIDLIRGAIMVLMAIDHVRVYSGLPAGGPSPGIFFTRWVTHFCAPGFFFLAGTSAFLRGRTHEGLSGYLFLRGLWLVILELTFLRLAWTFNLDFAHYEMAGVIWALGWCMILMAALVKLPVSIVGVFGLAVIACHNLLDPHMGVLMSTLGNTPSDWLWKIFYVAFFAGPIRFGPEGPNLIVLYSIVPWIGVMAAGFGFGKVLAMEPSRRNRLCLAIGLGATGLFLVLRGFNLYGDPRHWGGGPGPFGGPGMPPVLSFLNTTKYPASLDFLLMTLGPMIALVPVLEVVRGRVARWISIFGRVPFFFYMLHIPLIHALALVVSLLRSGAVDPWLLENHPMGNTPAPDDYVWSLGMLYAVWGAATLILYFACRWFAGVKAARREWWLSYL